MHLGDFEIRTARCRHHGFTARPRRRDRAKRYVEGPAQPERRVMRAKGKGKYERYVKLRYWLLDSRAWNSLPGNAHSLYVRIVQRYRGNNNGQVPYSVREAAQALHVNKATASRLFKLLEDRGFIVCTKRGAFSLKTVKDASEWRLSEYDSDYPPAHATKDFMRWQPPEGTELYRQKFRTRVFQRNRPGTLVQPLEAKKAGMVTLVQPLTPESTHPWVLRCNTYIYHMRERAPPPPAQRRRRSSTTIGASGPCPHDQTPTPRRTARRTRSCPGPRRRRL